LLWGWLGFRCWSDLVWRVALTSTSCASYNDNSSVVQPTHPPSIHSSTHPSNSLPSTPQPFDANAPHNNWPSELAADVARLVHNNAALMAELEAMRALRSQPACVDDTVLVHTDIWVNNMLVPKAIEGVDEDRVTIIDFEFGAMGPAAYDIGHVIAMLVLSAFLARAYAQIEARGGGAAANDGVVVAPAVRRAQEEWMLAAAGEVWEVFEREWGERVTKLERERPGEKPQGCPALQDVLGMAGVVGLRWTIGQFNLFSSLGVEEGSAPYVEAVERVLHVCSAWLRDRRSIGDIREAVALARDALAV